MQNIPAILTTTAVLSCVYKWQPLQGCRWSKIWHDTQHVKWIYLARQHSSHRRCDGHRTVLGHVELKGAGASWARAASAHPWDRVAEGAPIHVGIEHSQGGWRHRVQGCSSKLNQGMRQFKRWVDSNCFAWQLELSKNKHMINCLSIK